MEKLKAFDVLYEDNFFDEKESKAVWAELEDFYNEGYFKEGGGNHGGAEGKDDEALATRRGFFPMRYKPYYQVQGEIACSKIFKGYTDKFSKLGFANYAVLHTNTHGLLYSLYTNGDEYKTHRDMSRTTCLIWLCKEPKKFEGGDLYLEELDKTIKFKNNRMVMFPGWAKHRVTPVVMDEKEDDLNGRFCITLSMWQDNSDQKL